MSARLAVLSAFLIPVACAAALLAALFTAIPALADTVFQGGSYGYDISYPQKTGPYPSPTQTPLTFGIVGVTGGHAFTYNSYLSSQYQSVTGKSLQPSLYMNLNYAIGSTARGNTGVSPRVTKRARRTTMATTRRNMPSATRERRGLRPARGGWTSRRPTPGPPSRP